MKNCYRFLLIVLLSFSGYPRGFAEELHIAVAANFAATLKPLITAFETEYAHTVKSSSGSTGQLFAQIVNAAPFDVFLAADRHYPERLEERGLAVSGTRVTYAIGQLVLWRPGTKRFAGAQPTLQQIPPQTPTQTWQKIAQQTLKDYLQSSPFTRLAIANPQTAPYGMAAQQSLQQLQQWQALQNAIVYGNNIGQTFQFIASGNAEAGFVALSQVKDWQTQHGHDGDTLWLVPASLYQPIVQQAVLLKKGQDNPAAHDFLSFLQSPQARQIITHHGYEVSP